MKTFWVFSILLAAACSVGEGPMGGDECVDPAKKNPKGACTMEYRPVCGCNGTTYGNACAAKNDGVLHWTQGECDCVDKSKIAENPKPCSKVYAPVCGCNGVTYTNSCSAAIAGVTGWTEGECPK